MEQEEPEQGKEQEQDHHLVEDVPDPFNLLSELDQADAEEEDPEEEAGAEGKEVEQGEVFWARERRGSFWPCQVVPYAMVPEQDARKFGQVARDGITWEQYNPLLTPWQMIPFLGITPFE